MTTVPEIRYVSTRQSDIAYQVLGDGPIDLLFCSGTGSHLDMYWEMPGAARFFQGLAAFSRLIMFDPRGVGLSDSVPYAALSTINLSQVFAGRNVGITEVADQVWLVTFMDYDLGYFDHETGRVESAHNPFLAKVLPMSPE